MRILLTGAAGTLGPRVQRAATAAGHEVIGWDRALVSPNDAGASWDFVSRVDPEAILHLALGAESWAGLLAGAARERGIPFGYTSSVMVFAQRPDGPYTIHHPRTADEGYGQYKARCEDAIWSANPEAMVARIGYQIDAEDPTGNNLAAHLLAQQAADGCVRASRKWIPATSFMADTASSLLGLLADPRPGLHHLDANARDAWDYHRLVLALAHLLSTRLAVVATDEPVHDQRLLGAPITGPGSIAAISARLEPAH